MSSFTFLSFVNFIDSGSWKDLPCNRLINMYLLVYTTTHCRLCPRLPMGTVELWNMEYRVTGVGTE